MRRSYYYVHERSKAKAKKELDQEDLSRERGIELHWRINTEVNNATMGLVSGDPIDWFCYRCIKEWVHPGSDHVLCCGACSASMAV